MSTSSTPRRDTRSEALARDLIEAHIVATSWAAGSGWKDASRKGAPKRRAANRVTVNGWPLLGLLLAFVLPAIASLAAYLKG